MAQLTVQQRVNTREQQLVQQCLAKFGHYKGTSQCADDAWGFAKLPALEQLCSSAHAQQLADKEQHGRGLEATHHAGRLNSHADGGPAQQLDAGLHGVAAASAVIRVEQALHTCFLDALNSSRAFHSPHCEVALSEAFGASQVLEGLAGSMVMPESCDASVDWMRSSIKKCINSAWSVEALKQGVALAKAGRYDEAHTCYNKAIELDQDNADAFVARGAAHANARSFQDAAADFNHALQINPTHSNAKQYLEVVMKQLASSPAPVPAPAPVAQEPAACTGHLTTAQHRDQDPRVPQHVGAQPQAGHGNPGDRHCQDHQQPSTSSSSSSGSSSSGSSEEDGELTQGAIKRALKTVLKARSKHKHSKSKHKHKKGSKSKRRKSGNKKSKKRRRS